MYMVRMEYRGRVTGLMTEDYETAVLAAQALYDNVCELGTISIWQGKNMLWHDGTPVRVSG